MKRETIDEEIEWGKRTEWKERHKSRPIEEVMIKVSLEGDDEEM